MHQQGSALKLLAAPQARENAALVDRTQQKGRDLALEKARKELLRVVDALRSDGTLKVKQADAVEAAIEDELIALRVGPFL